MSSSSIPAACPMHSKEKTKISDSSSAPAACPMRRGETLLGFNPDNNIPYLPNQAVEGQDSPLSLEKVLSSIPKAKTQNEENSTNRWEYPSPQQFYNALVRKGYETPIESVETMVDIHNFLNEGAWEEILKWEKLHESECDDPKLLRFTGKPQQLSPKAWFCSTFLGASKPFDRHDWIVDRGGKPVRYIIDYYGGEEDQEDDMPVFNLDVRPALDSVSAAKDRLAVIISNFFKKDKE